MFGGFCVYEDKNRIYAVLTLTTGPLRATIMLIWPSVKMSLTPLMYGNQVFISHYKLILNLK